MQGSEDSGDVAGCNSQIRSLGAVHILSFTSMGKLVGPEDKVVPRGLATRPRGLGLAQAWGST